MGRQMMASFFKPKKKALDTQHKVLNIIRFDHHGDGVAFEGDKPVFVPGVLPKEQVIVQLIEDKRQFARAKLIKILKPSPERIAPFCVHYGVCGGCHLQHVRLEAQRVAKQETLLQLTQKMLKADFSQEIPVICSPKGYRRRARLSLKISKNGRLEMGFRQRNSKEIVTISHCPVLESPLDNLLPSLYRLLDGLKGRRILGHVELVQCEPGSVLLLRTMKTLHEQDVQALLDYSKEQNLILYLQQVDSAPQRLYGEAPFYCIDSLKLMFEPQDFIQVNGNVNEKMVSQAIQWLALEKDDEVLDLFCGLGNFSLPLAKKVAHVVGVEGIEGMVQRAQENAADNGIENVQFFHGNLEGHINHENHENLEDHENQAPWALRHYNKILLDPARAGALDVMPFVAGTGATRVVYVSCNPITLARDAQVLINLGYRLEKLGMLDMFPHTGHLESMALFVKK